MLKRTLSSFSLSRCRIHIKMMIMMPSVRVFIHIFLLLCTILFCSSLDCPPLTAGNVDTLLRNFLGMANPSLNSFTPVCLSASFAINRYRHAAVAVSYNISSPSIFSYLTGLLSSRCLNNWDWVPENFYGGTNNNGLFNLPLCENCSDCNVISGPILQCIPCNSTCLSLQGSGRCFGSGPQDCCPFYFSGNCTTSCPLGHAANNTFICEQVPSIVNIDIMGEKYGFLSSGSVDRNYYIYDRTQGLANMNFTILCTFNAAPNIVPLLINNSYWQFNWVNDTLEKLFQGKPLRLTTEVTHTVPTSSGKVNVTFTPGSSVVFEPTFVDDLIGTYECGVNNVSSVSESVLVHLTTDNPLLLYEGPSILNLIYPVNSFSLSPLYAEFRYQLFQSIANTQLEVYYFDNGSPVFGSISLINVTTRTYQVNFNQALPFVAEVFVKLNLSSQLREPAKTTSITINSHGLNANPSGRIDAVVGTTVVLNCTSLVPSISTVWILPKQGNNISGPSLIIEAVTTDDTDRYICSINDNSYPSGVTNSIIVTLIVYFNDVVLRRGVNVLPNPSIINNIPRSSITIICNGLPGNGGLVWTSDSNVYPNDLSNFNGSAILVNETGLNELSLVLQCSVINFLGTNFTCHSSESNNNVSVYLTTDIYYISLLSVPILPLIVGQQVSIFFLAAYDNPGYVNSSTSRISASLLDQSVNLPFTQTSFNIFTYEVAFTASFLFNTTLRILVIENSRLVTLSVIAPPLTVETKPPYHVVSYNYSFLRCISQSPVTWIDNSTGQFLTAPNYNISSIFPGKISFTPYIINIYNSNYPPINLGLTSLRPVANDWPQFERMTFVCTICDDMDLNTTTCTPDEYLNPQYLPVQVLYHPVSLFINDQSLYNRSVITQLRKSNITLSCLSTRDHSNLMFFTDNANISDYLSSGNYSQPLVLSDMVSIEVTVVDNYQIILVFSGPFLAELTGTYGCLSNTSGVRSTILLVYDEYYVSLDTEPVLDLTLGTTVPIPFRASFNVSGSPQGSMSTFQDLRFVYPAVHSLDTIKYEISPYNYILYLNPVVGGINGTTTIRNIEVASWAVNFTVNIIVPTLIPSNTLVVVPEGQSANLSCIPSNSQVRILWFFTPQLSSKFIRISPGSCYAFDSPLQHTLTILNTTNANTEGTYYCYVDGDIAQVYVRRETIIFNVTQTCPSSVDGGMTWPATIEGMSVEMPCSSGSSHFSTSIVFATRYCLEGRVWSPIQFSGCTLVSGGITPFELITMKLENATTINAVQDMETQIASELKAALASTNPTIVSVSITNYIKLGSYVYVISEAFFNPLNTARFDPSPLQQLRSLSEFIVSSSETTNYGFQPSDVCECFPSIYDSGSSLSPGGGNGKDPVTLFQHLCFGVAAEPCLCILSTICTCQNPYVGSNGIITNCTVDSDSDGIPDTALTTMYASECINTSTALYCINDTCPNIYNPEQTPPVCDNTTVPVNGSCLAETDSTWRIYWPNSPPNTKVFQTCPGGATLTIGLATRQCHSSGLWKSVDVSNCTSRVFSEIASQAARLFSVDPTTLPPATVSKVAQQAAKLIDELQQATNATTTRVTESLLPRDLATANNVLTNTIRTLNASLNANNVTAVNQTAIADVLSNLLEISNLPGWTDLLRSDPIMSSELLLNNAENFGLYLALTQSLDGTEVLSRNNIVIRAKRFAVGSVFSNISFPSTNDLINFTNSTSSGSTAASIFIPGTLLEERAIGRTSVPVVNIIFNNLKDILQSNNPNFTSPGTVILSSQVAVQRSDSAFLQQSTLSISFIVIAPNFSNPTCVFWEFSNRFGEGCWSSNGLTTQNTSTSVSCSSSHLTSFAVLVDVAESHDVITTTELKALSVVTYIGLSISIVCLLLTVIFFLSFGKKLFEAVHNFVHLNLAISLLSAYIVFIIATLQPVVDNKPGCTFVAALLHYFFLSAFCWMLAEGVMLYLMIVVVFSTLSKKWWFFFLLGWVPALLPVIVTVGVAHDYYYEGHKVCWLSVSRNVIWAFVVPMIVIIIINSVFLVLVINSLIKNRGNKNAQQLQANKRVYLVKATIKASVILLPLLGVTWVIGLFAINQGTSWLAWLFTVANSLQGIAFFFFQVVRNEKVWSVLIKMLKSSSKVDTTTEGSSSGILIKKNKKKYKTYQDSTISTSEGTSGFYQQTDYELTPLSQVDKKNSSMYKVSTKKEAMKEEKQEACINKLDSTEVEMESQEVIILYEYEDSGPSSPTDMRKGSSDHGKPVSLKVEKGSGNNEENTMLPDEGGDFHLRFTIHDRPKPSEL